MEAPYRLATRARRLTLATPDSLATMMTRTQISLPPELHRRAKRRAAELGVSLSELTRRALEHKIGEASRPEGDISAIFGILGSGEPSDIAKHKDRYIADATWREYLRKMGRLSKDEIGPQRGE